MGEWQGLMFFVFQCPKHEAYSKYTCEEGATTNDEKSAEKIDGGMKLVDRSIITECLTIAQKQRLAELSAPEDELCAVFSDISQRDAFFKEREKFHTDLNRHKITEALENNSRPLILEIESALSEWMMYKQKFTQVVTPTFITADMLSRMNIDQGHPLAAQVFWLDDKRCLRPMLAPNLYTLMGSLRKITRQPVRIFECGSCFRKESQGASHLNEFTMLNFVELAGVSDGSQMQRLTELARGAMSALDIAEYEIVVEKSEVYGETIDIIAGGEEIASGAYGPHPLDDNWRISDVWVGIGFGIERIAMIKGKYQNIRRVGKGLGYLGGARLNV